MAAPVTVEATKGHVRWKDRRAEPVCSAGRCHRDCIGHPIVIPRGLCIPMIRQNSFAGLKLVGIAIWIGLPRSVRYFCWTWPAEYCDISFHSCLHARSGILGRRSGREIIDWTIVRPTGQWTARFCSESSGKKGRCFVDSWPRNNVRNEQIISHKCRQRK